MPGWKLRKAPKNKWGDDKYWVVDETGKHYSKDPLTKENAEDQRKALWASYNRGEMKEAPAAKTPKARKGRGKPGKPSPLAKTLAKIRNYEHMAEEDIASANEAREEESPSMEQAYLDRADMYDARAHMYRKSLPDVAEQMGKPSTRRAVPMPEPNRARPLTKFPSTISPAAVPISSPVYAARFAQSSVGKDIISRLGRTLPPPERIPAPIARGTAASAARTLRTAEGKAAAAKSGRGRKGRGITMSKAKVAPSPPPPSALSPDSPTYAQSVRARVASTLGTDGAPKHNPVTTLNTILNLAREYLDHVRRNPTINEPHQIASYVASHPLIVRGPGDPFYKSSQLFSLLIKADARIQFFLNPMYMNSPLRGEMVGQRTQSELIRDTTKFITALTELIPQIEAAQGTSGAGFFGDLVGKVKEIGKRVVSVATKGVRKGYAPSARKMLQQYGDAVITEMVVRRDPIQSALNVALNTVTAGAWNRAKKKLSYDNLFHLGLVVRVKKGGRSTGLIIEKNEVINIAPVKTPDSDTEFIPVPLRGQQLTLSQLMDRAQAAKGDSSFFTYDPFYNNCQDFVLGILRANGLATEDIATFVKQPLESLIPQLPDYTGKVAKAVTDLGGVANVILEGEGLHELLRGAGLEGMLSRLGEHRARQKAVAAMTPEQIAAQEARSQQLADQWSATRGINPETGMFQRKPRYDPSSASEKVFRPLVTGLTKAADFAAKEIAPRVGVPKVVTEAYKTFAPPTSEFYGGGLVDLLEGAGIFGDFLQGLKEGFAPAVQTYKGLKAVAPLFKLAAKGAVRSFTGRGVDADMLDGAGFFGDFLQGLKEGFAPAVQTYKGLKAVAPLFKLAAKGAVRSFTGRGSDVVTMPRKEYLAEHKRLIALLDAAGKEGAKQKAEIAKEMKGGRLTGCGKHKDYVRGLIEQFGDIPGVRARLEEALRQIEELEKGRKKEISKATLWGILSTVMAGVSAVTSGLTAFPAFGAFLNMLRKSQKAIEAREQKGRVIGQAEEDIRRQRMTHAVSQEMARRRAAATGSVAPAPATEPVPELEPEAKPRASFPAAQAEPRAAFPTTQARKTGRGSDTEVVFRSLEPSKQKGKKWCVTLTVNGRKRVIHFGAAGMDDFTLTKDTEQRKRYIDRHEAREDWTASGITTPGFWSKHLLWNKPTIAASLADVRKRFGI